jgi:benzodiazapine receptor
LANNLFDWPENAMNKNVINDGLKLVICLAVCIGAGLIGSIFTRDSIKTWYIFLQKPSFTPPSWLFAPVWFLLYILMGIALFLVWRKGLKQFQVRESIIIFIIQLVLNAAWSFAFFGLKSPVTGLIVIVPLWTAILLTIINFFRVSRTAAYLLIPYIIWVSYATVLTFSIYLMNPSG